MLRQISTITIQPTSPRTLAGVFLHHTQGSRTLTPKELGKLAGISESGVSRVINHSLDLTRRQFFQLIRCCKTRYPLLAADLMALVPQFCAKVTYAAVPCDHNRNGRFDLGDGMHEMLKLGRHKDDQLEDLYKRLESDEPATEIELMEMRQRNAEIRRGCDTFDALLDQLGQPAKPGVMDAKGR